MILPYFKNTFLFLAVLLSCCGKALRSTNLQKDEAYQKTVSTLDSTVIIAANKTNAYLPLLANKNIAVVANQTSVIFKANTHTHLVDSLIALKVNIIKVFAPEHGFRGEADAGEHLKDGFDPKTGIPLISLYGKNKKPSKEQLAGVDLVLFDIQDVGVRFYTYIATLQLVMEACAASHIPVVVLDRPNPNAHYIDGPMMEAQHTSFLGMTKIPLVYGMTIGEYAIMINDEGWLENGKKAALTVIPMDNYTHNTFYSLPIRPSPNLPNDLAIRLYPSLGLFEGTHVNAGRGTEFQFQRYGASFLDSSKYTFNYTPQPNFGSKHPKENGKICYGVAITKADASHLNSVDLQWLIDAYTHTKDKSNFFITSSFTQHAGTEKLEKQIEAGLSTEAIHQSWQADIDAFKAIRNKYVLYH